MGETPSPALADGQQSESVDNLDLTELTAEGRANDTSLIEMEQHRLTLQVDRHLFI